MNKQVKQNWIAALRSGKYKQNDGTNLRNAEGFDALGVLCDLYYASGRGDGWIISPLLHCYSFDDQTNVLPLDVADWAGIPQTPLLDRFIVPIPVVTFPGLSVGSICDVGLSFNLIAKAIENSL